MVCATTATTPDPPTTTIGQTMGPTTDSTTPTPTTPSNPFFSVRYDNNNLIIINFSG